MSVICDNVLRWRSLEFRLFGVFLQLRNESTGTVVPVWSAHADEKSPVIKDHDIEGCSHLNGGL